MKNLTKNIFLFTSLCIVMINYARGQTNELVGYKEVKNIEFDYYESDSMSVYYFAKSPVKKFDKNFIYKNPIPPLTKDNKIPIAQNFYNQYSGCTKQISNEFIIDSINKLIISPYLIKKNYVTNGEYLEFVNYVKDSITRSTLVNAGFDSYEKQIEGSENVVLNWNTKIDWKNPDIQEALYQMYIPISERFNRKKDFDARKLIYVYYTLTFDSKNRFEIKMNKINVFPDTLIWSQTSNSKTTIDNADYLTSNYFSNPKFRNYPVVGLNVGQINAFLYWKNLRMNRYFEEKMIPINSTYSLPYRYELQDYNFLKFDSIEINKIDYSALWKISNSDYAKFLCWIRDSVARRTLILSDNTDYQLSFKNEDYEVKYDPLTCAINHKVKIDWGKEELSKLFKSDGKINPAIFKYDYCWLNLKEASKPENKYIFAPNFETGQYNGSLNRNGEFVPIKDRGSFIFCEKLNVYPDTSKTNNISILKDKTIFQDNKTHIQNITYKQAMAYYHWKKIGIMPDEDQYNSVKAGKSPIVGTKFVNPARCFRYVIRLTPVLPAEHN